VVRFRSIISITALVAIASCGEVVRVSVYPFPLCHPILALGDSIYVIANAERSNFPVQAYSSITKPEAFSWATSAPNVMTVSPLGIIRAMSVGTATITASAEGFSGSADFRVARVRQTASISPSSAVFTVRDTILLVATAWDSAGAPIDLVNGQTLFSTDGDARVANVWESLPGGARLIGFEPGTSHVSWGVGQRCGVLSVVVR
jgi:hypothetical protein